MARKISPGTFERLRKFVRITEVATENAGLEIQLVHKKRDWNEGFKIQHIQHHMFKCELKYVGFFKILNTFV